MDKGHLYAHLSRKKTCKSENMALTTCFFGRSSLNGRLIVYKKTSLPLSRTESRKRIGLATKLVHTLN